jgi:hypothetical protein
MKVVTLLIIRIDAFALIHLDMLIFVTVVKVKNDHVCVTIINTKKVEGTILRHLSK